MSNEDAKPPPTWTFKADDDVGLISEDGFQQIREVVESIRRNASEELEMNVLFSYLQSIKCEGDKFTIWTSKKTTVHPSDVINGSILNSKIEK